MKHRYLVRLWSEHGVRTATMDFSAENDTQAIEIGDRFAARYFQKRQTPYVEKFEITRQASEIHEEIVRFYREVVIHARPLVGSYQDWRRQAQ